MLDIELEVARILNYAHIFAELGSDEPDMFHWSDVFQERYSIERLSPTPALLSQSCSELLMPPSHSVPLHPRSRPLVDL